MNALLILRLIAAGGLTLLTLVIVQMLVGYRKITFRGPLHLQVHKWLGWAIVVAGIAHGTAGLGFVLGLW